MCRLLNPNFCTQEITGSKKVEFFYFPIAIQHEHKCISVKARGRKREREYDYCQNKLNRQEQKRILLAEIRNCSFSLHQHISNKRKPTFCCFYKLCYKNDASRDTRRICHSVKLPHLAHLKLC